MGKRLTTKEFIQQARIIHGDKYNYDKVNYITKKIPVIITCPIHGDFSQTPSAHKQGQGCPECGKERIRESRSMTQEEWIERANQIHNYKYDYSKTNYKGAKENVIIICPIHGEFLQNANNHIREDHPSDCPKCAKENQKRLISSNSKEFIEKARQVHGDKYDYSKVEYINAHVPVIIICPKHGEFLQAPCHHLEGSGCPNCKTSKGEDKISNFLNNYTIKYIPQYTIRIDKSIRERGLARIDFYLPEYNAFIEYNGEQHYKYIPYFHTGGIVDFEKQQARDKFIRNYCKENKIQLLEIKYNEDVDECLREFILNITGTYD